MGKEVVFRLDSDDNWETVGSPSRRTPDQHEEVAHDDEVHQGCLGTLTGPDAMPMMLQSKSKARPAPVSGLRKKRQPQRDP